MKPLSELTPDDLSGCAIWELSLSSKVTPPNEGNVRPRRDLHAIDARTGVFAVRSRFEFANGSEELGYCVAVENTPEHVLGYLQPAIVTPAGRTPFWLGLRVWVDSRGRPCGDDVSVEELEAFYRALGRVGADTFPIQFESELPLARRTVASGVIPGFGYLRQHPVGESGIDRDYRYEVVWRS
jgi:hypothetical protein